MDNQYYYKLMASYLSKKNCDESFMRYFFGKNVSKKTAEDMERADERKRRLQRERSRRYRALKNARRQNESGTSRESVNKARCPPPDDELSDSDEPPTLCDLGSSAEPPLDPCDESSGEGRPPPADSLRDLLTSPNAELDYPTVHSLMFHWLQT